MFKRKRLFERGDSYRDTGIPCGNPKRVQTGEVLCMPSTSAGPETMVQTDSMETQGEEQLRAMAHKQLQTNLTMPQLLSQRRTFTEAGQYKPVVKEIKGIMKLQEYEDLAKGDQRVETLRQYGLTEDEIRLQLDKEGIIKTEDSVGKMKSTYGAHPGIRQDQLNAIDSKIKDKEASLAKPDAVRGVKEISRQEMDIEKSMFWGTSHDSKALTNLLTEKTSKVTGDPNDPINHLPQLMLDIEERAREKIREKRKKRRRNRRHKNIEQEDTYAVDSSVHDQNVNDDEQDRIVGCLTFEEMTALKNSEKSNLDLNTKIADSDSLCIPTSSKLSSRLDDGQSNAASITSKSVLDMNPSSKDENKLSSNEENVKISEPSSQNDRKVLKGPVEFLPMEYIMENRLSLEDIKKLPKFANYEAGNLSNVLYVKNLSAQCCERDLISLFGRFQAQQSPIIYRLMTGRMRGQAFVTFESTDVATQALELVNGYTLHGKPVIVHYGKGTTA